MGAPVDPAGIGARPKLRQVNGARSSSHVVLVVAASSATWPIGACSIGSSTTAALSLPVARTRSNEQLRGTQPVAVVQQSLGSGRRGTTSSQSPATCAMTSPTGAYWAVAGAIAANGTSEWQVRSA